MAAPPVTEMVQNPLGVSYQEFLRVFTEKMEPILLVQPGLVSVITGLVVNPAADDQHPPTAVSLAQWRSLEAHEAFLQSPSAGPFFEAAKSLLRGPPTIHHYQLGSLSSSNLESRYSRIEKTSEPHDSELQPPYEAQVQAHGQDTAKIGACIEIPQQKAYISFGDGEESCIGGPSVAGIEAFTVAWDRYRVKALGSNL
ncbi:hypothetical protein BN1708_014619 [Verticillium longisporum]|uniref:ABM domain-containing protein n=1 Tax=Verticillium longisporum TaxID=100787 RepID=A0A0G4LX67_VERLO|nr:hypothetical protein BN1708_014619 [Verticillium longisporum]